MTESFDCPAAVETWPDLSIDQTAWELAECILGKDAAVSALAARAQVIKEAIKSGEITVFHVQNRDSADSPYLDESEDERERRRP